MFSADDVLALRHRRGEVGVGDRDDAEGRIQHQVKTRRRLEECLEVDPNAPPHELMSYARVIVQSFVGRVPQCLGLEHLPFAEVWFHEIDDARRREASAAAAAIGKTGLEAWTTDRTPRSRRSSSNAATRSFGATSSRSVDLTAADEPAPPAFELTTFAARRDLAPALFEIARESYPDQPGRSEQRMESFEEWRSWGLDSHPGRDVLHRARRRPGDPLRLSRPRRRNVVARLRRSRARLPRQRGRKLDQARADSLGEGERRERAAHGERGAARRDARAEQASRLPGRSTRSRAPRAGRGAPPVDRSSRQSAVEPALAVV